MIYYLFFQRLQGLAGRKTNLAITTSLLIQTEESVFIAATDLETGFEGFYPAKIDAQVSLPLMPENYMKLSEIFPARIYM